MNDMHRSSKKPYFIVVDGIDGSGKTTICNYIQSKTQAQYMRIFGQGPIGKAIREKILKEKNEYNIDVELNWFIAANLETIYDCVIPALDNGNSVILDRFLSSTYAYQIYRMDHVPHRGVKDAYFQRLIEKVLTDISPTLYILCDANIETVNKRLSKREGALDHFDMEDSAKKVSTIQGFETFYDSPYLKEKVRINCNNDLTTVLKDVDMILSDFNFK